MPTEFESRVWEALKKIPSGKIATYKQIATALGKPGAARAIGNACNKNPDAPLVPCHRVVKSNGEIWGYSRGQSRKTELLEKEGIEISGKKVKNFKKIIFEF